MKAIKITEANKINFKNREVGSWFVGKFPEKYIFQNQEFHGYKDRTDIHAEHGWVDLVNLPIGENQKRTSNIIEVEGGVAYEVVDLTEAEIEAKIPTQISTLNFQLGLLLEFNITDEMVLQGINAIEDATQKAMLQLLWTRSNTIDRTDPYLIQFGADFELNEDAFKLICSKYANFR